jgi:hypothetical protein
VMRMRRLQLGKMRTGVENGRVHGSWKSRRDERERPANSPSSRTVYSQQLSFRKHNMGKSTALKRDVFFRSAKEEGTSILTILHGFPLTRLPLNRLPRSISVQATPAGGALPAVGGC